MEEIKTKICGKCGRELPLDRFSKSSASRDGLQYNCKDCAREANQKSYKARREAYEEKRRLTPIITDNTPTDALIKALKARDDFSLSKAFTAREILNALYDLGYRGQLTIVVEHTVNLSHE